MLQTLSEIPEFGGLEGMSGVRGILMGLKGPTELFTLTWKREIDFL